MILQMLWVSRKTLCLLRTSEMALVKVKSQIELWPWGKVYSVVCEAVQVPTLCLYWFLLVLWS